MRDKYVCIVCGKKFPKGQGVVLVVKGRKYPFHSKGCAVRFFRRLIEELDPNALSDAFERVRKSFEDELRAKEERNVKKIA